MRAILKYCDGRQEIINIWYFVDVIHLGIEPKLIEDAVQRNFRIPPTLPTIGKISFHFMKQINHHTLLYRQQKEAHHV